MLAETLGKENLGYTPTATYKYLWIKRDVLPDGKEYCSMLLVYVDDILCFHKDMPVVIYSLASIYALKQGSMGPPDRYLGENIYRVQTNDGKVVWETHSEDYYKAAIENLDKTLKADGKSLSQYGNGRRPYLSSLHP